MNNELEIKIIPDIERPKEGKLSIEVKLFKARCYMVTTLNKFLSILLIVLTKILIGKKNNLKFHGMKEMMEVSHCLLGN